MIDALTSRCRLLPLVILFLVTLVTFLGTLSDELVMTLQAFFSTPNLQTPESVLSQSSSSSSLVFKKNIPKFSNSSTLRYSHTNHKTPIIQCLHNHLCLHAASHAAIGFWALLTIRIYFSKQWKRCVPGLFFAILVFAIGVEMCQELSTTSRNFSVQDIMADMVGASLGVAIAAFTVVAFSRQQSLG